MAQNLKQFAACMYHYALSFVVLLACVVLFEVVVRCSPAKALFRFEGCELYTHIPVRISQYHLPALRPFEVSVGPTLVLKEGRCTMCVVRFIQIVEHNTNRHAHNTKPSLVSSRLAALFFSFHGEVDAGGAGVGGGGWVGVCDKTWHERHGSV